MFQPVIHDLIKRQWREILEAIIRCGAQPVRSIAEITGTSYMTAKEHCEKLAKAGYLLRTRTPRTEIGRPEIFYSLAPGASALFGNPPADLALSLLEHARTMFGEHAPEKILFRHFETWAEEASQVLAVISTPATRIARLAALRSETGHVCEPGETPAGTLLITEFHNPLAQVFARFPHALAMETNALEQAAGFPMDRREIPAGRGGHHRVVFEFSPNGARLR
ncbi:MAG: winged helix-turn-helix transcriptional regulator [Verrucomicrobiota bacterium]